MYEIFFVNFRVIILCMTWKFTKGEGSISTDTGLDGCAVGPKNRQITGTVKKAPV